MGKEIYPKLSRLNEILRRQDPPAWGPTYDPAIRAIREEAPPRSRPAQVWSGLVNEATTRLPCFVVRRTTMSAGALVQPRPF